MEANKFLTLFLLAFVTISSHAQVESDTTAADTPVNKKRLRTLVIGSGAAYGITLFGLNELWYKDASRQSFQFFNDNAEWKQVDKIGHFYSSFYFSYGMSRALRWTHVQPRKADIASAITGFLIMVPIEIMDGYSDAYGASGGDLIANAAGSVFFLGQALAWQEIRIYPKFSFHTTSYADRRPSVLGDGTVSEIFKDYNGQTHWLSVDVDKFIAFPKWLNIGLGYGAEGMIYARDHMHAEVGFDPFRQYYLSVDFDLTAIRTRSKAVKTLIFFANMIKFPAPAIEFSRKGARFHALFF
jgi:hypothetical protein